MLDYGLQTEANGAVRQLAYALLRLLPPTPAHYDSWTRVVQTISSELGMGTMHNADEMGAALHCLAGVPTRNLLNLYSEPSDIEGKFKVWVLKFAVVDHTVSLFCRPLSSTTTLTFGR